MVSAGFVGGATVAAGTIVDGRYRIERLVGEGAMASVYAAHDAERRVPVALKLLKVDHRLDADLLGRFVREARVASRIESEHVAAVYGFGTCESNGGVPYIAFELLHGEDLGHLLARAGALPVELAVDYMMQALAGVAAAHMHGIAHRDLKPSNLFLATKLGGPPILKVLDFGVAKALRGSEMARGPVTSTSTLVGSPVYMAPEQLRSSKRIDVRADIWSLGVVLYELLTGGLPFDAPTFGALLAAVMEGAPVPPQQRRPDLPPALADVILRCLARERGQRFQSVRELAAALAPFGSAAARSALEEVEDLFSSETAIQPAFGGESSQRAPFMAETPLAETRRRTRPPALSPALVFVLVIAVLLLVAAAAAAGFLLARG